MTIAIRRSRYDGAMALQIQSPRRRNSSEPSGQSLRDPRRRNDALWPNVLNNPGARVPTQRSNQKPSSDVLIQPTGATARTNLARCGPQNWSSARSAETGPFTGPRFAAALERTPDRDRPASA